MAEVPIVLYVSASLTGLGQLWGTELALAFGAHIFLRFYNFYF